MAKIKVMIADDHEMVRLGLSFIIKAQDNFELVGEASDPSEAVKKVKQLKPDVVLMDVRFPDGNGIEACREIMSDSHKVKVLMLSSYSDDEAIVASIMAGASGYVLKQIGKQKLVEAIERVYNGDSMLDPAITGRVLNLLKNPNQLEQPGLEELNETEKKILIFIAEGKTNKEIAQELFLSYKTIKNYVSNVLAKLGLSNRAEAAAFAVRHRFKL
ncbi:response regulator transcription factor [Metallumcola ferriviriculae]|uniref:Stage 0 sporulation protein A homolog n=1 Tax=Metallumcola ferriviriculae TaxID=3039180 RepID=A0AAU0UQL2_9FIRM|nr:response regulator transcription factor [Desulfitibacteraceae bacterium MK1]